MLISLLSITFPLKLGLTCETAFYAKPLVQQQRELHATRQPAEATLRPSPVASAYVPWDHTGPGRTLNK